MEARPHFDDNDAVHRTQLANERTFLAWWRSGLTALGVSLAVGRVIPELSGHTRWPYVVVGSGYAVLGVVMVGYGTLRQRAVDEGIRRGEFVQTGSGFVSAFAALSILVGIATFALILI